MEDVDSAPSSATADPIAITADDREARGAVLGHLRQRPDVSLSIRRLRVGDYEIDGRCVIERKTIRDFAISLVDGRLFRQAVALARFARDCALILEGGTADAAEVGVRREALQGALISLSLIYQIPILRSRDPEETARLLAYAGHQLHRHKEGIGPAWGRKPRAHHRRVALRILQGLPHIGPGRAAALLDHFGTVAAVMVASAAELAKVPGIGSKTAWDIRGAVGEAENRSPKQDRADEA